MNKKGDLDDWHVGAKWNTMEEWNEQYHTMEDQAKLQEKMGLYGLAAESYGQASYFRSLSPYTLDGNTNDKRHQKADDWCLTKSLECEKKISMSNYEECSAWEKYLWPEQFK